MHRRIRSPSAGLLWRILSTRCRQFGFWLSVLLPLTYLPVLVGLDGERQPVVLAALVAVNVVALVVSHDYSR